MSYREIHMLLDASVAERLSDAFMEAGALSSAIEDAHAGTPEEQAIFGEPNEETPIWEKSLLLTLFDSQADVAGIIQVACQNIGIKIPVYQEKMIPEKDWVRLTQSQFDPIKISSRLWIVPSWHNIIDDQAINIRLDPGLAFGTGSHPTTRLCLEWLDKHIKGNETVLDYGCGSGILAITARKLGASVVDGVDIDPQAVLSAQQNACDNAVSHVHFYSVKDYSPKQYDIVVANILANPLRMLGAMLAQYTVTGGFIVLSGILREQVEEISHIYAQWFKMEAPVFCEDWACLTGVRQPNFR